MRKKWKFWTSIAILSMMLAACGSGGGESEETAPDGTPDEGEANTEETVEYKIGATQIVEHPSLDAAYEGFKQAIADAGLNATYDFQSAQNDENNASVIASNFVADEVDLIFANSTPSALAALQATSEIPIVFTSVTDPVGSGLVPSMDEPGANITGVVDLHPDAIQFTVEVIDKYFSGARVGLIYNAGEANSVAQIEAVEEAAKDTSLSIVTRTVSSSAEVQQAASTLVSEVDVFYIVTDNTVVSALESVVSVANEQQIPLVVGEPDSLARGGFATYGIDYYSIGYRSGEMAVEILTGEKTPADIPVEYPSDMKLIINKEAAELQGVEWNSEWDEIAEIYTGE